MVKHLFGERTEQRVHFGLRMASCICLRTNGKKIYNINSNWMRISDLRASYIAQYFGSNNFFIPFLSTPDPLCRSFIPIFRPTLPINCYSLHLSSHCNMLLFLDSFWSFPNRSVRFRWIPIRINVHFWPRLILLSVTSIWHSFNEWLVQEHVPWSW